MPALNVDIEWPDGEVMTCYSPSTVVLEYFQVDAILTVEELVETSHLALSKASQRVEEQFGFICKAAITQKEKISRKADYFEASQKVRISAIRELKSE
jgi:uncharacterized repeat protein (TIGR04042 family)